MDMATKEVNNTLRSGGALPEVRPPLPARLDLMGAQGAPEK